MSVQHHGFLTHDVFIKWKHFPRYWPFVWGLHRSLVNYHHKGQWRGALMFSLICARISGWVNNREAGDLRRRRAHYDVIVMALRPGQNGCHFADAILKNIFVNQDYIFIKIVVSKVFTDMIRQSQCWGICRYRDDHIFPASYELWHQHN